MQKAREREGERKESEREKEMFQKILELFDKVLRDRWNNRFHIFHNYF